MIKIIKNYIRRLLFQIFKKRSSIKLGLYGPPNAGKCVTPESEVVLFDGKVRPIKDIFEEVKNKYDEFRDIEDFKEIAIDTKNSDLIVPSFDTKNFKIIPKKVSYVYAQKYKGNICIIETRNGRKLRVTPNHPLIRISDAGVEKVRSAELQIGESIAITKNLALNSSVMIPEVSQGFNINNNGTIQALSNFHNCKEINIPSYISEELVSFVAYVIAESYHTKNRIKFSNLDKNLLEHFDLIVKKLFNLGMIYRINKGVPEIEINSKTLTDYLEQVFGFRPCKSDLKEVPSQFMGLPDNLSACLLRSLFDCEGYVSKSVSKRGAEIEFCSKSKRLVEQVQLLLNRFGIVGRFKKKFVNEVPYYRLLISGSDNHRLFREKVGFNVNYKAERLDRLCGCGLKRNKFGLPIVNLLDNIRKKRGLSQKEFFLDDKHVSRMKRDNRITYHRLANMAKNLRIDILKKLSGSDVLWDEIKSIKKEKYNDYVYDLTVEDTHTFLTSSGLIASNTTLANKICKDWLGEQMGKVSKIPHETRKVGVKEKVEIKSKGKEMSFNLVDTPGIATKIDYENFTKKFKLKKDAAKKRAREATRGVIEAIKWLDDMDAVLVVLDATQNPYSQVNITIIGNLAARDIPVLVVANKMDLKRANLKKVESAFPQYDVIGVSAEKGHNIEEFYESLFRVVK